VKEIVKYLHEKYNTTNPFTIAKRKNIIILHENLGKTLGYCNTYKRQKIIHINENIEEKASFFVCAHELAHILMHPDVNTPFLKRNTLFSIDKIEREANTFAVELLMPDFLLTENNCSSIYNVARSLGIPENLIHLKK
jgi:Zn-dependent peptidase ImmA (M78 family)